MELLPIDHYELADDCLNYYIFVDETGTTGQRYYGFGFLWVPATQLADFRRLVTRLRTRHEYTREIKWTKIDSYYCDFYLDLVDAFFDHDWIRFDVVRVNKSRVDLKFHSDDLELAMRKHYARFLQSRIGLFAADAIKKVYHVMTDDLPFAYQSSAEAIQAVANNELVQQLGRKAITSIKECDSKRVYGIQLTDVLLGAALEPWNQKFNPDSNRGKAKYRVIDQIASTLGWTDLRPDTYPSVWKYNICHFYPDGCNQPREVQARQVSPRWDLRHRGLRRA